jgi:hypothetical protein
MPPSEFHTLGYALVTLLLAACRGPEVDGEPEPGEAPVVGKLQFQDHIVDLTLDAFSDDPNADAVPTNARANVMADVILDQRGDDARCTGRRCSAR